LSFLLRLQSYFLKIKKKKKDEDERSIVATLAYRRVWVTHKMAGRVSQESALEAYAETAGTPLLSRPLSKTGNRVHETLVRAAPRLPCAGGCPLDLWNISFLIRLQTQQDGRFIRKDCANGFDSTFNGPRLKSPFLAQVNIRAPKLN